MWSRSLWSRVCRRLARPINPKADEIEGVKAYPDLASAPGSIDGVSIITPPKVTEHVVAEAVESAIKFARQATKRSSGETR